MTESAAPEMLTDDGDHPDRAIGEEDDVNWTDDVAPIRYPENPLWELAADREWA